MASKITFTLNGQDYCTKKSIKLSNLLNYFDYTNSLLVLEHNSLICNKNYWENIWIVNNDKIEIVTVVGGG